ncbi:MAG: SoxR reducing system RseC family protein [Eubacteriaceae bacterium]|nr:SoxR reducing system RseC family protein [Eubacteriaceae bacterium]
MKEIGIVNKLEGNKATVVIKRHAACGDCGACQVGKEKMTMETVAFNKAGAVEGEEVEVELQFSNVMQASFIAYGIPLVMFIVGSLFGFYFINGLMNTPENPITAFICGILMTVLTFIGIRIFEKQGLFAGKYEPQITNIIK